MIPHGLRARGEPVVWARSGARLLLWGAHRRRSASGRARHRSRSGWCRSGCSARPSIGESLACHTDIAFGVVVQAGRWADLAQLPLTWPG